MEFDTVVIYHADCADGLAAAWCFKRLGHRSTLYHAAFERDFLKDKRMPDLVNKNVFIVDFSYPREMLEMIGLMAKYVTVLDHHQTAAEVLSTAIPGVTTLFDMKRCAAEIVWDYFFPSVQRPWWFKHIRDRDLWLWEHPASKGFAAHLWEKGLDFQTLEIIDGLGDIGQHEFIRYGNQLLAFQEKEISRLCDHAKLVTFEGHRVYALNTISYRSEVGGELAKRNDCAFAFLFSFDIPSGQWRISLRGVAEKGIDLSTIAKKYGGGGHPLACGFTYQGSVTELVRHVSAKAEFAPVHEELGR